jgi:glycine/D-amino acid oxidase-like deaminating enzyme
MTDDSAFAPNFVTTPFWWEDAPPPAPAPPSLPDAAEVAIIGGGIAGLSCALELGRAGVRALVMDREAIGWGASSRNGGALSGAGSLGRAKSDVAKGLDPALLAAMVEEAEASFDALEALIAREAID